ncbi:uncharacterized protein BDV17DRAFT_255172 [Aspergillus undulatus]|uniref:uncharacterized protein n=1 Tax=Aspergillus undulatus TaxID=1810928 RepID=UPI003CCCAAD2
MAHHVESTCPFDSPTYMAPVLIMAVWESLGGIIYANLPLIYKPMVTAFHCITGRGNPSATPSD